MKKYIGTRLDITFNILYNMAISELEFYKDLEIYIIEKGEPVLHILLVLFNAKPINKHKAPANNKQSSQCL